MKILFFTQLFYPSLYGGGEKIFYQWANELQKKNHIVHVITQNLIGEKSFEIHNGIHIHRVGKAIDSHSKSISIFGHFSYFAASVVIGLKILRKIKFDIIHSNSYIPVIAAQFCAKILHVPHVATVHDVYLTSKENFWHNWSSQEGVSSMSKTLGPWLEKRVLNSSVSIFHTVSEQSKKDMKKFGCRKEITVIPNGINCSNHGNGSKNSNQVIFVGRLIFYKNVDVLIDAFKKVIKKIPNAKLIIVGEGPEKNNLEQKTKSLRLEDSIEFRGNISNEEKNNLISQSSVLVNPSTVEGFGLVILESFCHKTPVIVSDIKPLSDLVTDGVDGFLAKAIDSDDWSEKIIKLISNLDLVKSAGEAGFEKLKKHHLLSEKISQLEKLYEKIASKN